MVTAAGLLSPGFKYDPDVEQILRFFLLPYLRHRRLPVDDAVLLDDPTRAPPWTLLDSHGRGRVDEAYFIGPAPGAGRGGRQKVSRSVAGGGKWIKQSTEDSGEVRCYGETFKWEKCRLSFHFNVAAGDRRRSHSTGWVMHEYVVVPPPGSAIVANHSACRISFTGHGKNRKRVPDDYVADAVEDVRATSTAAAAGAPPLSHEPSSHGYCADTQQDDQQSLPATEQSNQDHDYAYTDHNHQQSNQHHFPAAEQVYQDYLLSEIQSNQEHGCEQDDDGDDEQYHVLYGDLTSCQEPVVTSQPFLYQEQVTFTGLDGGHVNSDDGEHAGPRAVEPLLDAHLTRRQQDEIVNVDHDNHEAHESAAATASHSAGAPPPLQQPSAPPTLNHLQEFVDQLRAAKLAGGGGLNGAPLAEEPAAARGYHGPMPTMDSACLEKIEAYLTAAAKKLCGTGHTSGEHCDALPPVQPGTAELARVVGLFVREVVDVVKVAAAGDHGASSDQPLSDFDKAQNVLLTKLMVIINRIAMG
uniref:NAC domain-containing protein n=1 Tax=Oryza brachyantha TaxID=4533 RepID=J3LBU2_ORYBR